MSVYLQETQKRLTNQIVDYAGDYLSSSRDHKAVGRRPFDKMATLLAYLGPPEHKPVDSQ